jgi:hypothetical protein
MLWNKLWLVIPNLTLYFLYLCCFTLYCFIFYSATVSGITWCIQPWCVYVVKHIKCCQGGREEAVLYGLWWVTGSGRGSYINSQINYKINLHSLRNRLEKLTNCSLFYLFLKLVQINYIFSGNVRILYMYL